MRERRDRIMAWMFGLVPSGRLHVKEDSFDG
jgi:hypothetical protein